MAPASASELAGRGEDSPQHRQVCTGLGRRGTEERGGGRDRERRRGVLREGGCGWQKKGSGTELASQNHSCLDRLATGPGRPYIPPPPRRRRELWLGAGVSLSVPIVKSGVPLTLPVSRGGGTPRTLDKVSPAGGGPLASPGQVSEPPTPPSPLQLLPTQYLGQCPGQVP